jgi:two-component system LytT family sensor kinase
MKDLLKKPVTFEKVEFWVATAIYVFAVFTLLGVSRLNHYHWDIPNEYLFEKYHVPFSYVKYYFLPELSRYTLYYCAYLALTFIVVKRFTDQRNSILTVALIFFIYAIMFCSLGTTDTWIKCYLYYDHSERYLYHLAFKQEAIDTLWLLIAFGFYNVTKYFLKSIMPNISAGVFGDKQLTQDCIVALGIWLLSVFFLSVVRSDWHNIFIWSEIVLVAIGLYWYSFYNLIPAILIKGKAFDSYLLKVMALLAISFFPVALFIYAIFKRGEASVIINLFNIGVSLFIVVPLSWFVYKGRLNKTKELHGLKTALGSSAANLDFLRSQINPHFLFNALNTLYGTSLQENAERTGEGIQKLGDMMRFMLQENMQEKISVAREVEYLNNYIDLQKLRTQTSPDILIQTTIDEQLNGLSIAPMLLIPFVENAFKHGISLREPSHIKVSLQTKENELLFDVYNSIHPKPGNDPEKDKSGIGLENVKQRLQLLYPNRHELVVRESGKEFFIHLTVLL